MNFEDNNKIAVKTEGEESTASYFKCFFVCSARAVNVLGTVPVPFFRGKRLEYNATTRPLWSSRGKI